jgi:hypothetical protein
VLADFDPALGWDGTKHLRIMGDLNGDGRADIIGFGDAGVPMTAVRYSIVSSKNLRPRKYRKVCTAARITPTDRGWGFLHCLDVNRQRVTLVTDEVGYMELLIAGRKAGAFGDLAVPVGTFPISREGWPDDW